MEKIYIKYNKVILEIILDEGNISIDGNMVALFRDERGRINEKSFYNMKLITFIKRFIQIVDHYLGVKDFNEIVTIKYRDFEFEIDIIDDNMLIDPRINNLFLDKRGVMTSISFKKQPLIKFLTRIIMIGCIKNIDNNG